MFNRIIIRPYIGTDFGDIPVRQACVNDLNSDVLELAH